MTIALIVIAVVAAFYAGLLLFLWRFQERIVFQPPREAVPERVDGARRLSFAASDGVGLHAYIVAGRSGLMVYFHGNAVLARWMIPWAQTVSQSLAVTVALVEY